MKKYSCFAKILWKRTERNYIKEIITGTLFATALCIAFFSYLPIVFLLLWVFFSLYQITCMFKNETFWSNNDFEIIGIKANNTEYKIFNVISRIICDTTITNLIIFLVVSIFFLLLDRHNALMLWVSMWFANIIIAPSNNYLGYKVGETISIAITILFVLITSGIILAYASNIIIIRDFFNAKSIYGSLAVFGITFLYIIITDYLTEHYRTKNDVDISPRRFLSYLRKKDIMVYKDLFLLWDKLLVKLISTVTMAVILIDKDQKKMIPGVIIICLISDWFDTREKKKYLILSEDTLFNEIVLVEDKEIIRKSKLRTVFSEVIVKMLIGIILGICCGVISLELTVIMLFLFCTTTVLQFLKIYDNNVGTNVINVCIKYSMVILSIISLIFDKYYFLVIFYIVLILVIYSYMARKVIKS